MQTTKVPAHQGATLRAARLRRGLTQDELAAASGISQTTISRCEQAADLATVEHGTIGRLCQALDVPTAEITGL